MVKVQNIRKVYGTSNNTEVVALNDVSIDFRERGLVFLLGKSGCGKSTLLHILGGLDRPSGGELILDGKKSSDFSAREYDLYRNEQVGFVFQNFNLINEISVYENVALSLKLQGKKDVRNDVIHSLESVDVSELINRMPSELSGGQKQRVAIARALVKKPKLIIADEPTGALDSENGENVFRILKEVSKNKLVIVASHDRVSAEAFGDRVIELKDGKVIKDVSNDNGANKPLCTHASENSEFKKGRLPLLTAAKIALSNFKKKKAKLVSAIVISSVAFSMFGAFFSLMTLDENRVVAKGVNASNLPAVQVVKMAQASQRQTVSSDSELDTLEETDGGERAVFFNPDDVAFLNQRGSEVAGVFSFASDSSVFLKDAEIARPSNIYYGRKDGGFFAGFSDCGESYCAKHFILQTGSYPASNDEIAISSFKAQALLSLVDGEGKKLFNSVDDLLASTIRIGARGFGYYCDVSISGIYQTNDIPSRFEDLKTFPGYTNTLLANEFYDFKDNSFMEIAFVSSDFYERSDLEGTAFDKTKNGKYRYVLTPSPISAMQVETLNSSSEGYSFVMGGDTVLKVKKAVSNTLAFKLIFAIIGVGLGVISSFFLFGFIRDSVNNKEKEIGILRSNGASMADIFRIFAIEATAISLVIAVLANVIGAIAVHLINKVYVVGMAYFEAFEYGFPIIALVAGSSLLFSYLAAILPVSRVCKKDVAEIVKNEE